MLLKKYETDNRAHLYGFVEPAVAGVVATASTVQHLVRHVRLVSTLRPETLCTLRAGLAVELLRQGSLVQADQEHAVLYQLQVLAVLLV